MTSSVHCLVLKLHSIGIIKSRMVTQRQNSTSSVVGLICVTDMIDSWRALKSIVSVKKTMVSLEVTAQVLILVQRLQNLLCTFQIVWGKKHLTLSSTWALASNICLMDTATCSCYQHFIKCSHFNYIPNRNRHIELSSD